MLTVNSVRFRALRGGAFNTIDDMHLPPRIVALREVLPEMRAAAFFAPQRGSGDQPGDGHEIQRSPRVGVVMRRRADVRGVREERRVEARRRGLQPLARPEQAGVAPHEIADVSDGQRLVGDG